MTKLTDKQHKRMIALYAETQNYSLVAREFGVSVSTVRRHCNGDGETVKKVNEKKAENTAGILAHMGRQKNRVCSILDRLLDAIEDPERLSDATLTQLATTLGILVDKYTAGENAAPDTTRENNLFEAIAQAGKGGFDTDAIPELLDTAAPDDDVVGKA